MDPNLLCYAYVDGTKEFVCPLEADYDPLVEGNVLWPRNTTRLAPPEFIEGTNIPVFDEDQIAWVLQPDYRGRTGYDPDGRPVLINRAGNPSTFDPPLTTTPPPVVLPDPGPVTQVSAAQALIQLSRMPYTNPAMPGVDNLADATELIVQSSSDRELKIWFSRAQQWYITNPNVKKLGAVFDLSDDQIQEAFDAASQIEE